MVIDAYSHDVPRQYYDDMGRVNPSQPHAQHPQIGGFFDYEQRVEHLNEAGIDQQVVTLGGPHLWHNINTSDAVPLIEQVNDEIRHIADEYPDWFIPVGTIPVRFDEMVEEAQRCINELDMAGIQLYTNYSGTSIDAKEFHPIFELTEEEEVPIWLHPQTHRGTHLVDEYNLNLTFGWLFETTLALSRLVLSGLMERYSNLRLVAHHGAAMVPHFIERVKTVYGDIEAPNFDYGYEELTRPVESYFGDFFVDTVLFGSTSALETVYDFFGPEKMLFATDYPYGADSGRKTIQESIDALDALDLSKKEMDKVLGGNAKSLLRMA